MVIRKGRRSVRIAALLIAASGSLSASYAQSGNQAAQEPTIKASIRVHSITTSPVPARAQVRRTQEPIHSQPINVVAKTFYRSGKEVRLTWTEPAIGNNPGSFWYEVALDALNAHFHTMTSDTAVRLDSLPDGFYAYSVIAHNSTDTVQATGNFAVAAIGEEGESESPGVRLFPNPLKQGNSKLNILLTGLTQNPVSVQLLDMQGNVIDLSNVQRRGDQLELNPKELAVGMYYCIITSGKQHYTAPLIVE